MRNCHTEKEKPHADKMRNRWTVSKRDEIMILRIGLSHASLRTRVQFPTPK